MFKNAGNAIRITKEVRLVVREELSKYTDEEMNDIYSDNKKLMNFSKKIYPKFSDELKSFMTLNSFQDMMLKQKKNINDKPSIINKIKKIFK